MPNIVKGTQVENLLSGRRMLIEWSLNDISEGVVTYKILRSTNSLSGFEEVGETTTPTRQFIDKVPFTFGSAFFYKVIAVDASGRQSDLTDSAAVSDLTFDGFEEFPFRPTNVTFDSFIKNEEPTGAVDGLNTAYTTSSLYRIGTLELIIDGATKTRGVDYTENNDQQSFTTTAAPTGGQVLRTNYLRV